MDSFDKENEENQSGEEELLVDEILVIPTR